MKRLLIVGASHLQLPGILKAKEMGLYIGVADYNPNADGIPYADEYYNASTIDQEAVYQAAKAFKADGIMTLATDMPMRSVAYTCEKLGLCGISMETAVKATDKAAMIRAFETHGVTHPWYVVLDRPERLESKLGKISFPCICKPVDSSGSRGVMLVHHKEELKQAVAYSAKNGRNGGVIVEEYLLGSEVSAEVIVIGGQPHVLAVTDKITTGAPHFVEMGHNQPSRLGERNVEKICQLAKEAAKAVGIEDGAAHVEIMLTAAGPKMIELGARLGGDCITTHLVPLSTGIDMVKAAIEIALGIKPKIDQVWNHGAAIRYFHSHMGKLRSVVGLERARALPGVHEIYLPYSAGMDVRDVESSTDRLGHVVATADTATEAIALCEEVLHTIEFNYF